MFDLIDRQALGIGYANPLVFDKPDYAHGWNSAIEIIQKVPTVDAVEIVRCKDCQFCLYNEAAGTYKCRSQQGLSRFVEPTDFCSWGERVIEDETNKC